MSVAAFSDITPELKAAMPNLRGRLLANQSLGELTWFRVGGPAQVLFTPSDEDDLAYFLGHLPNELPLYVVGVGSNLIVRDGGMPGVVIRLSPRAFGDASTEGEIISAGAAALDKRVAETAAAANLAGLEFYFGIPGTIGGALRMNAGANGAETKDVLLEATGIDRDHFVLGLRAHGHREVIPLPNAGELAKVVRGLAGPGDLVVCLGAGNITQWAYALPGELKALG